MEIDGIPLRYYDQLALGFVIKSPVNYEDHLDLINVRVLLKVTTVAKTSILSVLVPTGTPVSEIDDFAEYCLQKYNDSTLSKSPLLTEQNELLGIYQVRRDYKGEKQYNIEFELPKGSFYVMGINRVMK